MFDTYQEHVDHEAGVATELQNAFRESKANTIIRDETAKICGLRAAGSFVLVCEYPVYCRSTDAILGNARVVTTTGQTRYELERALEGLMRDADQDTSYTILEPMGGK